MEKPDILLRKITVTLLFVTLLVSAVFVLFPQLDILISKLFWQDGEFQANKNPVLDWIRMFLIRAMWLFMLLALFGIGFSAFLGKKRNISMRLWAYPFVVSLVGPLILVNSVFKNNWGRARPISVREFGGELDFTPAYYLSDQCITNCSFTSGEGGAIATVVVVTGVLLWRNVKRKWLMLWGLTALFILGAGLRVIKGQHFFSDTLLSALFCALIALFFYWWMDIGTHRQKLTVLNLKADFGLFGQRLRRNVSRK